MESISIPDWKIVLAIIAVFIIALIASYEEDQQPKVLLVPIANVKRIRTDEVQPDLILKALQSHPRMTAKEMVKHFNNKFTKSSVNSALYKLLSAKKVKLEPAEVPRWSSA